MRIASTLYRGATAALGLVLYMAAAVPLAAQTAQNPILVLHNSLQFAHQVGTLAPTPQTIRVYSAPPSVNFTATVSTQTGGGWLFVNNGLTFSGNTNLAGQNDLTVTVSPSLPIGNYNGTVSVTSGSTIVNIQVALTVSANPVVRLEPNSLVNTPLEARRSHTINILVSSSGTPTQYSATVVATTPATGWLTVFPDQGITGSAAALVVNAGNIPDGVGLATAIVRFTTLGGPVTMPISIALTAGAQLQVSPSAVTFPYQIGFAAPAPRMVNVTSSTQTQLGYIASITSSTPWLTLSTMSQTTPGTLSVNGTTPGQLWLIPNIAAAPAAAGTYEGNVRIETATGSVQNVTARLVVSTQPQLTLSQDAAAFSYTLGGLAPASQTITVGSTSFPQSILVTPTYTSGGIWFTVVPTSGTTPQNITISVDPTRLAQLSAGTYTGSVRVQSSSSDITIPASLTVSGSALITVEPMNPDPFTWQPGQPTPPERTLIVRSTDATNQPFTVAVEYAAGATGWLVISPTSGATGATGTVLRMNVNTTAVGTPGTYDATIVITPTGVASAPAVRVPIKYILTGAAQISASPSRIEVTQIGTTPPATQTISLTSTTPGLTFLASGSAAWIRVNPTQGSIPGTITVSFESANLAPGDYSGSVTISVGGAQTLSIPVALRVQSAATLQVSPAGALTFAATQNAPAPAQQTLSLTSTGVPINYTATATSTVGTTNWLRVEPTAGTTPATLRISVDPSSLAPGSYSGVVTINATNASNPTTTVNVNLTVSAQATPSVRALVNAASNVSRGVSPGLIATLYGTNMAPSTQMFATVTNGVVGTTLGEVQVLFDNIPAPILYAGPGGGQDQINVVVPYGVGGRQSTSIVVSYRGVRSTPITYQVNESLPGIFTALGGSGNGSILNQNNSTNGATNPARRGEVIQIYSTGEGAVVPAVLDGRVIPAVASELRRPVLPVQVRLGDLVLTPDYAGSAPGLVSGAFQVNVTIPANFPVTATQNVPLSIVVGVNASQAGVTVAVAP